MTEVSPFLSVMKHKWTELPIKIDWQDRLKTSITQLYTVYKTHLIFNTPSSLKVKGWGNIHK